MTICINKFFNKLAEYKETASSVTSVMGFGLGGVLVKEVFDRFTPKKPVSFVLTSATILTFAILGKKIRSSFGLSQNEKTVKVVVADSRTLCERGQIEKKLEQWVSDTQTPGERKARNEASKRILACFDKKTSELDLSCLSLTSLPDIFRHFQDRLVHLQLQNNNLNELPDSLYRLVKLETMNLESNPMESLSQKIYYLKSLKFLNLNHTRLALLPGSVNNHSDLYILWDLFDAELSERRMYWLQAARNAHIVGKDFVIEIKNGEMCCRGNQEYLHKYNEWTQKMKPLALPLDADDYY